MKATKLTESALSRQEQRIREGFKQFMFDAGDALAVIRQEKLYHGAGYKTFERYCAERWSISRARAYQLVDAAAFIRDLSTNVDNTPPSPTSEGQIRSLMRLPAPEQRRDAWQEVVGEFGPDATQPQILEVVEYRLAVAEDSGRAERPRHEVLREWRESRRQSRSTKTNEYVAQILAENAGVVPDDAHPLNAMTVLHWLRILPNIEPATWESLDTSEVDELRAALGDVRVWCLLQLDGLPEAFPPMVTSEDAVDSGDVAE